MSTSRLMILLSLITMASCLKNEMVGEIPMEQVDTMTKKPQKILPPPLPPSDTTSVDDTSRVGIGFNPTVEDWDEENNIDI